MENDLKSNNNDNETFFVQTHHNGDDLKNEIGNVSGDFANIQNQLGGTLPDMHKTDTETDNDRTRKRRAEQMSRLRNDSNHNPRGLNNNWSAGDKDPIDATDVAGRDLSQDYSINKKPATTVVPTIGSQAGQTIDITTTNTDTNTNETNNNINNTDNINNL